MQEVGFPVAVELPPKGHERYTYTVEFNQKLIRDAHGALPPYDEGAMKICSLMKSHTTQAMRCAQFGVEIDWDSDEYTDDGHISLHKIEKKRPSFAKAAKDGFEWDVLVWEAEEAFGSALIQLLQDLELIKYSVCFCCSGRGR